MLNVCLKGRVKFLQNNYYKIIIAFPLDIILLKVGSTPFLVERFAVLLLLGDAHGNICESSCLTRNFFREYFQHYFHFT